MYPDKPDIHESPEWLISYSDLMSLLLCFFVMLYAISTLQTTKFQSATESLRGAFGVFGEQPLKMRSAPSASRPQIGGTILFDWGSDDLSDSAKQELNTVYRQLLGTSRKIQIVGWAGLGEPSSYRRDMDLAYSRAINVWDHLVSLGMNRERCQIVQQTGTAEGARVEIQYAR